MLGSTETTKRLRPYVSAAEVLPAKPFATICAAVLNPLLLFSFKYSLRVILNGSTQ